VCYFGKEFLGMTGIAQMLHARKAPQITIHMPTESEFDQYNRPIAEPEIKPDHSPAQRLPFLDRVPGCVTCLRVRHIVLYSLALYGLYSLIF
jgi:hypothetical protein